MNLLRILDVLRRRWLAIVVVTTIAMLAFVATMSIKPTYEAVASVMISDQAPTTTADQAAANANELAMLATSVTVIDDVRRALHLKPTYNDIKHNLNVRVNSGSDVVPIAYHDKNAAEAVSIANGIANRVVAYMGTVKAARYDNLVKSLTSQRAAQKAQMTKLDSRIQQLTASNAAFGSADATAAISQNVQQLEALRSRASATLAADQAIASAQGLNQSQLSPLVNTELLDNNPAYRQQRDALARDKAQLASQSAEYTSSYPGLADLKERVAREERAVDSLRTSLLTAVPRAESRSYSSNLEASNRAAAQVQGDRAQLAQLDSLITNARWHLSELPTSGVEIALLRHERDAAQASFTALSERLTTALGDQSQAASLQSAVVVDPANRMQTLLDQNVTRRLIWSLIGSLMLGIAFAYILELIDKRFRTPFEIETAYGLPVLGSAAGTGSLLAHRYVDAVRMASAAIDVALREPAIVLVTSAKKGDGKTDLAVTLAKAFAETGRRTLLIDANFRNPSVARRLSVDHLASPRDWDMLHLASVSGKIKNLETVSVADEHLVHSISTASAVEIMAKLRHAYDRVVIDAGTVLNDSLALRLSAAADGVLIALRLHRSVGDEDRRLIETLDRVRANMLGIVAVDVDSSEQVSLEVDRVMQNALPSNGRSKRQSLPSPELGANA